MATDLPSCTLQSWQAEDMLWTSQSDAFCFFLSGWAWLISDGSKLAVTKTGNAETPLHLGKTPLLTMDVWGALLSY